MAQTVVLVGQSTGAQRWSLPGAGVAYAEGGAGLADAAAGALAAATGYAGVAVAVAVLHAGVAVGTGRRNATAVGPTALALRAGCGTADGSRSFQRGAAGAGAALAVLAAGRAERAQALSAASTLEPGGAERVLRSRCLGCTATYLTGEIAAFTGTTALAITADTVKAAATDTIVVGRASAAQIVFWADAGALATAHAASRARFGTTCAAATDGGLAVAGAALCIDAAGGAAGRQTHAATKTLPAVTTADSGSVGLALALRVAGLTGGSAGFLATDPIDTAGARGAGDAAGTRSAGRGARIDAVPLLIALSAKAGRHFVTQHIDGDTDRVARRLAFARTRAAVGRLQHRVLRARRARRPAGNGRAARVIDGSRAAFAWASIRGTFRCSGGMMSYVTARRTSLRAAPAH
jgi:hypothetical protein